jgi:threonine dehydrogenase-like Zn-dependent dehydrogenase
MRALVVTPGHAGTARLDDVPEPPATDGAILARTRRIGICGTDAEIVGREYGWAPLGETHLVRWRTTWCSAR